MCNDRLSIIHSEIINFQTQRFPQKKKKKKKKEKKSERNEFPSVHTYTSVSQNGTLVSQMRTLLSLQRTCLSQTRSFPKCVSTFIQRVVPPLTEILQRVPESMAIKRSCVARICIDTAMEYPRSALLLVLTSLFYLWTQRRNNSSGCISRGCPTRCVVGEP